MEVYLRSAITFGDAGGSFLAPPRCMQALLLVLLASSVGTSCIAIGVPTASTPEPGAVSFEWAGAGGAAVVVPVRLNDAGPFPFVLDTGATLTCIDRELAAELDLSQAQGIAAIGGGLQGLGSMQVVAVPAIEVGTARATDLHACVIDLAEMQEAGLEARGLLGLNFLKAYRLTIDFEARQVKFDATADAAAP